MTGTPAEDTQAGGDHRPVADDADFGPGLPVGLEHILSAFLSIADELDLQTTLHRIVRAAADLVDAQYGALGVVDADGRLADFVYVGLDDATRARIQTLPSGRGLVGLLMKQPQVIRLDDLTTHPAAIGFPAGHPPMRTFIGAPIRLRDTVFGHLYLTEKRGGGVFTEGDEVVLRALASAAGSAVQNARLFTELRRRERWLMALAAVRSELMTGDSVDDALVLVAERAAALADADGAVMLLPDEAGALNVRAVAGSCLGLGADLTIEADDPAAGALQHAIGVLPDDAVPLPRNASLAGVLSAAGTILIAPVPVAGARDGVLLCVRDAGRPPFRPDQQPELVGLAEQASLALDVAGRREQRRRYELLAERERIARDLHDHVIQRLFAVGLSLQRTERHTDDVAVRERLEETVNQVDEAIRDLRSSIYDLRTGPEGARRGLRHRVLDIVTRANDAGGPAVTGRVNGPVDTLVPPALAEHAVAVVREAVSNAVRHSGGSAVAVTVSVAEGLTIDVVDDGRGLPSTVARSGLSNLADRAASCDGEFATRENTGGGTHLTWSAPLPG